MISTTHSKTQGPNNHWGGADIYGRGMYEVIVSGSDNPITSPDARNLPLVVNGENLAFGRPVFRLGELVISPTSQGLFFFFNVIYCP